MKAKAWLSCAAVPAAVLLGACGSDDDAGKPASAKAEERGSVLKVADTSTPGDWSFDKKSLTAKAGKVTIQFHNPSDLGHNVRVQTGDKCCFGRRSKDLGGTEVIGRDIGKGLTRASATLDLKPGKYWFLCANPGHWQAGQVGRLVVN